MKAALARVREAYASKARLLGEEALALQEGLDAARHTLSERGEENAALGAQVRGDPAMVKGLVEGLVAPGAVQGWRGGRRAGPQVSGDPAIGCRVWWRVWWRHTLSERGEGERRAGRADAREGPVRVWGLHPRSCSTCCVSREWPCQDLGVGGAASCMSGPRRGAVARATLQVAQLEGQLGATKEGHGGGRVWLQGF